MDMFMDKLAQRLTAEEIIKANTAAETEELNKLRNQIAEYNECLARLQRLISEGEERLTEAQKTGSSDISRLAEESILKVKALQQDTDSLEKLQRELSVQLGDMDKAMADRLSGMDKTMDDQMNSMDKAVSGQLGSMEKTLATLAERLEAMTRALDEKLARIEGQTAVQLDDQLRERLNAIDENVHKECVKVYRNVQAVVVEEGGRQSEVVREAVSAVEKTGGRLGVVLGFSAAAFVFSLVSVVMQILSMLNIITI